MSRPILRLCASLLLSLACLPLCARAELMLNPTRVVFAKNQRAAQVELINNGSEPATYRINLVNRRMTETGEFQNAAEPLEGERFADAMLTYSPRRVTLQPGTAQVVRVMVRRPDGLPDGEYRSHLHFEKLPAPKGADSVAGGKADNKQIGVMLTTLVGTSIPVIVRQGPVDATVALTHLALEPGDGAPALTFHIERSGASSVYGDLEAAFLPAAGPEQVLAKVTGVAVYVPNALRRAAIALRAPAGVALARGTLRLTFRERPEAGGKILAQATHALP